MGWNILRTKNVYRDLTSLDAEIREEANAVKRSFAEFGPPNSGRITRPCIVSNAYHLESHVLSPREAV